MSETKLKFSLETNDAVLEAVGKAIASILKKTGYGSVEITIHGGRVTQLEQREKIRFEPKSSA